MDYKTFSIEFDVIKNRLIGFINKKNRANVERASDIVNDYLKEISEGSYSLKSYKAKIIHNELEHTKTKKEFSELLENINSNIDDLFKTYFEEYLDVVKNEITSPTKEKDMKDYNNSKKKERQDVINKKNALDRDTNDKVKELEQKVQLRFKEFGDKSLEYRLKMQSELNKLNDKVIKEYSPFEGELVEVNERDKINIIKEKIKGIRLKGLNEEYQYKLDSYDSLYKDEYEYITNQNDDKAKIEIVKIERNKKVIEYDSILKKLDIQLENHDHNYDAITESENINNCYKEIDELVELIKMSNQYIISFNNRDSLDLMLVDRMFIFDFAILNLDYLLVFVRRNNVYDSLAKIIIDIINIVRRLKESTVNLIREQNTNHKDYQASLYEVLKDYDPNSRKVTKEEFLDNVITSLDRYYINFFNEIYEFNMASFNFISKITNIIRDNLNRLIPLNDNLRYLPSNFMEESYKYNYINLNDYFGDPLIPSGLNPDYTKDELLEVFASSLKVTYQERKEKITVIMGMLESDYNKNLENLQNDALVEMATCDNEIKDINSKYEKIKQDEYLELEKSISALKANAKKSLDQSIKYL